ncbi:MAG: hypothetical protein K2W95_16165 [Candidatus Obscuribacterales bacterium]|nr:hypothetical protein [Candidatus Obscuribacterales bacterium]
MQVGNILRSRGMLLIYLLIAGCVATATAVVMSTQRGDKPQDVAVDKPAAPAPAVDVTVNVPKGDTATIMPDSGVVVVAPAADAPVASVTKHQPTRHTRANTKRRIAAKPQFPGIPEFEGDRLQIGHPDSLIGVHDVEQWSGNKKRVFAVPQSLIRTDD